MEALCIWPGQGSIWLSGCEIYTDEEGNPWIDGQYRDTSDVGSDYLPIDYSGHYEMAHFPLSCVLKVGKSPIPYLFGDKKIPGLIKD